jgi:hypothetical protein
MRGDVNLVGHLPAADPGTQLPAAEQLPMSVVAGSLLCSHHLELPRLVVPTGSRTAEPVDVIPGPLSRSSKYPRGGTESLQAFDRRPTCGSFQNSGPTRQPGPLRLSKGVQIAPLTY